MRNFKTVSVNLEERKITVLFDENGSNITKGQIVSLDEKIKGLENTIKKKVEKVDGKGLSTNDFTNEYKAKIDTLEQGNGSSAGGGIKRVKFLPETPESEDDVYILDNAVTVVRADGEWMSNLSYSKFLDTRDGLVNYDYYSKFKYTKRTDFETSFIIDDDGYGNLILTLGIKNTKRKRYGLFVKTEEENILKADSYNNINGFRPADGKGDVKVVILDKITGYFSEVFTYNVTNDAIGINNLQEIAEDGVLYRLPNGVFVVKSEDGIASDFNRKGNLSGETLSEFLNVVDQTIDFPEDLEFNKQRFDYILNKDLGANKTILIHDNGVYVKVKKYPYQNTLTYENELSGDEGGVDVAIVDTITGFRSEFKKVPVTV